MPMAGRDSPAGAGGGIVCGRFAAAAASAVLLLPALAGCGPGTEPSAARPGPSVAASGPADASEAEPRPTPTTLPARAVRPASRPADAMSAFVVDSPFEADYKPPAAEAGKRIWAQSVLWQEAPRLVVEKWLSEQPQTQGKYLLIEFWATWCPPCRRSISLLNSFHRRSGKELVVIGISDETEPAVRRLKEPAIEYYSAIDTQARMKNALGVHGIPHVIVVEPGGCVVWEGFPLLKGHELTEEVVETILRVGRKATRP